MGGVNPRSSRECGQPGQRAVELLGSPFEQPSAASGKQGIAAKKQVFAVVGDMIQRVAGDLQHLEIRETGGGRNVIALAQCPVDAADMPAGGSENRDPVGLLEGGNPAHMIGMVVGDENGGQLQPLRGKPTLHGGGLAGVDHHGPIVHAQGPDVIVAESGEGRYRQHMAILVEGGVNDQTCAPTLAPVAWQSGVEGVKTASRRLWRQATMRRRNDGLAHRMTTLDAGTDSRLQAEAQALQGLLSSLAGRVAVQIGACAHNGVPSARFTDVFCLDPAAPDAHVRARLETLPLLSESVDLLLMMHSLDCAGPRSAWVAEAARVLRPEGRLAVVGCRVWRGSEWLRSRTPPLGVWRLRVLTARHGLSWEYARGLKAGNGTGHGVYLAVARRRMPGTMLLRPVWQRQKKARHSLEVPGAGRHAG